jgi:DNA polymerase II large subunit
MALSKMGVSMPSLVKGVRGLSSERRIPEPIEKGILRAIHEVYVNKDGTIRFDAIETPITHFKPREVGTSVEQLKQLGYTHDINNKPLENENQVLEMFPQDIVLPDCKEWKDSSALDMLMKTCSFIDELLVKYYGKQKYYNVNSASDLVGHLIIGIAPHTSAGIIGRIIGFSKTQCFYAHPYFHSACRRNCVHPNTDLIIYDKKNNMVESKPIGPTIETLIKNGAKVKQDGDFSIIEAPEEWQVFSINPENHDVEQKQIRCFIKGPTPKNWVKIKTALGREFVMTPDHTFLYSTEEGELKSKAASEVAVGDRVPLNYKFNPPERRTDKINLIAEFLKSNNTKVLKEIKITGAERYFKGISKKVGIGKLRVMVPFSKQYSLTLSSWYKAVPLEHFDILLKNNICKIEDLPDGAQVSSWQTSLPIDLGISPELMRILGYYLSEGHTRENRSTHQISFRICQQDVFADMVNCLQKVFGLRPNISEGNTKASISTNIVYYIFTEIFKIGKGAKTKRVPSFVFNLNKELLSNFISAYFDGDGNVLDEPLRLQFYSTSQDLLNDIGIVLSRFGIMARYFEVQPRLPGKTLIKRYSDLGKEPGLFGLRHLTLGKADAILFSKICKPTNTSKRNRIENISKLDIESERYTKFQKQMIPLKEFCDFTSDIVKSVEEIKEDVNCYCLDIITDDKQIESKNVLWGNQLFQIRCDGDELAFILLVDALLNFSRHYLPDKRGSRYMDLPLVLTTRLDPQEVDDEVYNMDIADIYPTEFYKATLEFKSPYEVKVKQINSVLGKPEQYRGIMYTHPVESINFGNRVSSYKTLVTIFDKVQKQMELAEKTRAINKSDVARILIEKHFLKDIKGNLRKYSHQEFRCISCNTKYRRVPLVGRCNKCAGKLVLTVAEGTVSKYLEPSLVLAEKYSLPTYLRQTLDILKRKVDSVFGKEATKQVGLGSFVAE